ncbi:hypothetical protein BC826DRAFT_299363 [Russula brevipes]|nr:hypothetical protein BC826DRAFT_299363 [Russula brevipes]
MPSLQPARLTKKQKKATAFRERGGGKFKSKGKGGPNPASGRRARPSTGDNGEEEDEDEDANAVPAMEDQDQALVAMAGDTEGRARGYGEGRAVRVPKTAVSMGSTAAQKKENDGHSKKRRRGNAEEESEERPASKKAKPARRSDRIPPVAPDEDEDETAGMTVDKGGDGEHESETKNKESKAQRYILFLGNLKYTTTHEAIQNHFSLCDPPPTVRLLTPKVTRAGATVAKSKGCAFLEFSARPALQVALRLHQSELDGRRINVELTAGGGGKGDARLAKVKARNKQLAAQRTRRTVKAVTAQGKDASQDESVQPQRFSTTSGEGDVPHTKRTWSVGDEDQRGEHRRRTKAGKKHGTRTKNWGTGVNALPIG